MTDLASSGSDWLRDPSTVPDRPTGIEGTAWAWNPTLNGGQWVRSRRAFRQEQRQVAAGVDPPEVIQNPSTPIGGANRTGQAGTGMRQSQESARAIIEEQLRAFDLYTPEMANVIYGLLTSSDQINPAEVRARIRETDTYRTRFSALEQRRSAGLPAISEAEYLSLEREYRNIMRTSGMPTGFYDSYDDFAQFIANDVSPAELSTRVQQGYQAIRDSDPTVLATMRQFYGLTDGEIASYFLDPQRAESLIVQQVATAQIGAAAAQAGFSATVDRVAAERLQRAGVTTAEAQQTFGFLQGAQELLQPLERGEQRLDVTETALGLTGRGSPEAAQRLRTQQRRRLARFEGGGRFAASGAEVTGLQQAGQ